MTLTENFIDVILTLKYLIRKIEKNQLNDTLSKEYIDKYYLPFEEKFLELKEAIVQEQ